MRWIITALALFLPTLTAAQSAAPILTGQRASAAQVLPYYGYRDVDVRALRNGQVAQIVHLAHSGRSYGEVKGHIGAVLRGGLLQRTIERVVR
ncbi:MAG: hypothetical protein AAF919_05770 [Pseudomonadota bacterium]